MRKSIVNTFLVIISISMVFFLFNPKTVLAIGYQYLGNGQLRIFSDGEITRNGITDMGRNRITSVVVEEGVTSVGEYAFSDMENLTSVILADSVTSIGNGAFADCPALECVVMNISAYNPSAFSMNTTCDIHCYMDIWYSSDGHGTVSGKTRAYDTEVVDLSIIPDDMYTVDSILVNGEAITGSTFVMPLGGAYVEVSFRPVGSVGDDLNWNLEEGVLTIIGEGDMRDFSEQPVPWCDRKDEITSVVFSGDVTSIGSGAFDDCINLNEVIIPDSVVNIGDNSFTNCPQLDFVVMNSNSYNPNAFDDGTNDSIHFYYDLTYTSNGYGVVEGKIRTYDTDIVEIAVTPDAMYHVNSISVNDVLVAGTSFVMPRENVTVDVTFACSYDGNHCGDDLTWRYEYGTLTVAGTGYMFDFDTVSWEIPWSDYCSDIHTVVIEDGVESIGSYAFANCTNLCSVNLPDSLVSIGENAFSNCSTLSRVMIPYDVAYLGPNAFSNCSSITFVAMNSNAYNQNSFDEASTSKVHFYRDITYISYGHGTVTGDKSRTYDGSGVQLTITPDPLYTIGSVRINGEECSWVPAALSVFHEDIIVEVTFVPAYPMEGCCGDNLTWLYDEGTLYISGNGEMYNYEYDNIPWLNLSSSIDSIVIEYGVTSIGNYAFNGVAIESISFPETVTSIGSNAFGHCRNLSEIEIPNSVNYLGEYAFINCSNLVTASIPEGVTELSEGLFLGCSKLAEVSLPSSLQTIGPRCFFWCYDLGNINFPDSLTRIEEFAFYDCNSITSLLFPDGFNYLGDGAFESCDNLNEVIFPVNFSSIHKYAFLGCSVNSITVNYDTYRNNIFSFPFCMNYYFYVKVGFVIETNAYHNSPLYGQPDFDSLTENDAIVETFIVSENEYFELPYDILEQYGIDIGAVIICGANSSACELIPNDDGMFCISYGGITPNTYYTDPINDNSMDNYQVGLLIVVYEECDHSNISVNQFVEPYCTTTGLTEGNHCAYCGEILLEQNVINALGHDVVIDSAVVPGCLIDGASEGSHCARCYEILEARHPIPYTGHSPVLMPAINPDCTHAGRTAGSYCSVCGTTITIQGYIRPLGHTEVLVPGVAPDCTHSGITSRSYCSMCNAQLLAPQILPATGHTTVYLPSVAADCTHAGLTSGSFCQICNAVIVEQRVIPASGHTVVNDSSVLPTNTRTGLTAGSHCSTCGTVIVPQQIIPRLNSSESVTPGTGASHNNSNNSGNTLVQPSPSTPQSRPVSVSYSTHVQNIGWQENVYDGAMSGTEGMSLRLEAMTITVDSEANLGIRYRTHVQNVGWQDWVYNGDMAGTSGQGLRLEAMQIELVGPDAANYDVYYRVHVQNVGWMDWVKNGELAGTEGMSLRLEGMQIKIVPKDESANFISYNTHVQNVGWQNYVTDGVMAGTSGQSLRLEGIHIRVDGLEGVGVEYRTHIQNIGWENTWARDGGFSGTEGQSLRLEAIEIRLTGVNAANYDVYYRTHVQNIGWTGWASNGGACGSAGYAYRLEGIEIIVVPRGIPSPGTTSNSFYQA